MPGRRTPIVTDQFYHIVNRAIDQRPTFTSSRKISRALLAMDYYQYIAPPMKLSKYLKLSNKKRAKLMSVQKKENKKLVDFLSFCLMPNHFHFLLKQTSDGGISRFMSNFQNSYTRYFNVKNERVGPLFLDKFKAVRIETDEQLLHVSRYIYLNPYSSFVVKKVEDLEDYIGNSLLEYLNDQEGICKKDYLRPFFKTVKDFRKFIWNQADYQRRLEEIKHLSLEG